MFVYTSHDIVLAILLAVVAIVMLGLGMIAMLGYLSRSIRKFWK